MKNFLEKIRNFSLYQEPISNTKHRLVSVSSRLSSTGDTHVPKIPKDGIFSGLRKNLSIASIKIKELLLVKDLTISEPTIKYLFFYSALSKRQSKQKPKKI